MNDRLHFMFLTCGVISMPSPDTLFDHTLKALMYLVVIRQIIIGVREEGSVWLYIRSFFKKKVKTYEHGYKTTSLFVSVLSLILKLHKKNEKDK